MIEGGSVSEFFERVRKTSDCIRCRDREVKAGNPHEITFLLEAMQEAAAESW